MRGPVRPHTTQANQPPSLSEGTTNAVASSDALTGLGGTVGETDLPLEP